MTLQGENGPMEFKVYQAMPDGHHIEVRFKGHETMWKNKVFIFEVEEARRIFIWVGSEAKVREKFAGSRIAEQIRRRLGMTSRILTVDEGQETKEFFDVIGITPKPDSPVEEHLTADQIRNQADDGISYDAAEKPAVKEEPAKIEKEETVVEPQKEKKKEEVASKPVKKKTVPKPVKKKTVPKPATKKPAPKPA